LVVGVALHPTRASGPDPEMSGPLRNEARLLVEKVLQGTLSSLRHESILLHKLLLANRSQHSCALYYRKTEQVLQLMQDLDHIHRSTRTGTGTARPPGSETGSGLAVPRQKVKPKAPLEPEGDSLSTLEELGRSFFSTSSAGVGPSTIWQRAELERVARSLWAACECVTQRQHVVPAAAALLRELLARTYFMPFAAAVLAILGRLHVLLKQLVLEYAELYDALVRLLPHSPGLGLLSHQQQGAVSNRMPRLPSSIVVHWDEHHRPQLELAYAPESTAVCDEDMGEALER